MTAPVRQNSMKKSVFLYRHCGASGNPEILSFPGFRLVLAIASWVAMTFEYLLTLRDTTLVDNRSSDFHH